MESTAAGQRPDADRFVQARKQQEQIDVDGLGTVVTIREEIDDILEHMREFCNLEPDDVMRLCSGYSARVSEIRIRIQRIEEHIPIWRRVRIQEAEPVLEELKQQFNIASRIVSVRQLDWDMQRGS